MFITDSTKDSLVVMRLRRAQVFISSQYLYMQASAYKNAYSIKKRHPTIKDSLIGQDTKDGLEVQNTYYRLDQGQLGGHAPPTSADISTRK